jgi:WD40 repeat protein
MTDFAVAGVQNSYDNAANFVVFDLSSDPSHDLPKVAALDAHAEVTVIIDNHEAVTGTRSGELTVWSLRTGKPLRRLASSAVGAPAHGGEVTDVAISKDRQTLVSTSTDGMVRLWNLETDKLIRTLRGHTDEVWCCTMSNDGELIATGSRDRTIRLWRSHDGAQVAAINAGVDVFRVLLSNNKKTVVALADKSGARKLIMLQIVRSKTKSSAGSRATSPLTMTSSPRTPDYLRQL